MGRAPCCDKANVKRGPWSPEEDATLKSYLQIHGTGGNWIALPRKAGLRRCGKSCRLRWLNYLRPDIKHGGFTEDEDRTICELYNQMGSRWSVIASHLPGRTDNDVKNYWNTKLKKKLLAGKITLSPNYTTNFTQFPTNHNTSIINTTSVPLINQSKPPNSNSFIPKLESTEHEFSSSFPNSRNIITQNHHTTHGLITVHDQITRPSFSFDQSNYSLFSFSPRVLMDFSDHDQFNNNDVINPQISMQDQLLVGNSGSNVINLADSPSKLAVNDVKPGDGCDGNGASGTPLADFGFGLPYYDILNNIGVSFDQ